MSELRHDPIQKRWVIIAAQRAERPGNVNGQPEKIEEGPCPFCPGRESETPHELLAFRQHGTHADTPGWEIRVVPNRFPALQIEGELDRRGAGIYDLINGIGAHEVFIETPRHDECMADYPIEHTARVFAAYRERICDLVKDGRFRYILVFKNSGAAAGASLSHAHTQLIATPVTPRTVSLELDNARDYYKEKERCLFCDILYQERAARERIVAENDDFIAVCPFASRFPYEMFVAPRKHQHDFTLLDDAGLLQLAGIMKDVLTRLKRALNDPPYNFMIHSAPNTETLPRRPGYWGTLAYDFHWHIEIIPRLTRVAGFEWGTGFYINTVTPEDAARKLRETLAGP